MRAKRVFEFLKTGNVKTSLEIGREGSIRQWFRDLNISDDRYTISDRGVKFDGSLDLDNANIDNLPENLEVGGYLSLSNTNVEELPKGLKAGSFLDISNTKIKKLPKDLEPGAFSIHVDRDQKELIEFIKKSKFRNKFFIKSSLP